MGREVSRHVFASHPPDGDGDDPRAAGLDLLLDLPDGEAAVALAVRKELHDSAAARIVKRLQNFGTLTNADRCVRRQGAPRGPAKFRLRGRCCPWERATLSRARTPAW